MGKGRRTKNFRPSGSAAPAPTQATSHVKQRGLAKSHLGGVIFGCTNSTIKECLSKQLFGLPAGHYSYIKNIHAGQPLFLFNYSNRQLHGIFAAASPGQMNINPYAWTIDGEERTQYPAQVQIHVRLLCHPLSEEQFKPAISQNYHNQRHFLFELDHAQTSKLISLLSSQPIAPSTFFPEDSTRRALLQTVPSNDRRKEIEALNPPDLKIDFPELHYSIGLGSSDIATCLDPDDKHLKSFLDDPVMKKEETLIDVKRKESTLNQECLDLPSASVEDAIPESNVDPRHNDTTEAQINSEKRNEESIVDSFDYPSVIVQLIHGVEALNGFNKEKNDKLSCLEHKLVKANKEIESLKKKCAILESKSLPFTTKIDEMNTESIDDLIFLMGGYDGVTWLSTLDSYSPMHDVIKPLKPMNFVRSYAAVAILKDEFWIFGGRDGSSWHDTVESYDPANNQWTVRPSLKVKKGSLAGATLNNQIFAIGGRDGVESFADVEMFDIDGGHWISKPSMVRKRFALAAAELNGALYAVGGFNGMYLKSAERFDPREHSWIRIGSMNIQRACHSLAVLNEKIYAIGGYNGTAMVPNVEIFDPRLGSWITEEPMNQARGYFATAVFRGSIYAIGGVDNGESILETVERYEEGRGWQATNLGAIGKRCFLSAIVM